MKKKDVVKIAYPLLRNTIRNHYESEINQFGDCESITIKKKIGDSYINALTIEYANDADFIRLVDIENNGVNEVIVRPLKRSINSIYILCDEVLDLIRKEIA